MRPAGGKPGLELKDSLKQAQLCGDEVIIERIAFDSFPCHAHERSVGTGKLETAFIYMWLSQTFGVGEPKVY